MQATIHDTITQVNRNTEPKVPPTTDPIHIAAVLLPEDGPIIIEKPKLLINCGVLHEDI